MATILHTIVMPPDGGDTLFANMYAAYEALPESEKAFLKGKMVVHSWELSRENVGRVLSEDEKRDAPPNSHPLARVHPETGRTSLFIGMHASHIEGMSFEAGRAKILELEAHATKPEFQFRHHWRMGDLIMWDNRCLLHRADPNFDAAKYPARAAPDLPSRHTDTLRIGASIDGTAACCSRRSKSATSR